MSDTAFEVRYMRRVQEQQFEPAEAEIKAVFNADNSDMTIAENKLRECRVAVERVLGLRVSDPKLANVAQTPAADVSPQKSTADNGEVSKPKDTQEEKKRGRPSNKELAERAAKRALEQANNDPMAELIDDEPQQISTGDSRENPMDDVLGDLGEPPPVVETVSEKPITDQELQNEAGKTVQRIGDHNVVRTMVRTNYRVQRIDEVPTNLRRALVSDLRNLQKDGSIKPVEKK